MLSNQPSNEKNAMITNFRQSEILLTLREYMAPASPRVRDALLLLVVALAFALVSGCAPFPKVEVREPTTARAVPPPRTATVNGAIYQQAAFRPLFEDNRARFVGDILTIQLSESNNAQKSANNAITKKDSAKIDNPTILGASPEFALPGVLPLAAAAGAKNSLSSSINSNNDFSGKADAMQSNSLTGSITVTVADVLPNGNLLVRGEHRVGGRQVNLGAITCPLLTVVTERDEICPPAAAAGLQELASSADKTTLTVPGGHVGAVVGRHAKTHLYPAMARWLEERTWS